MPGIFITVDSVAGTEPEIACAEIVLLSARLQIPVHYQHNDILVIAYQWDEVDALIEAFKRARQHGAQLAFVVPPDM